MKKKMLYGYNLQSIEKEDNNLIDPKNYNTDEEVTEEFYDILGDENKKRKKRKKKKNHLFTVLIVILIVFGVGGLGFLAYVKVFFTAERFLDDSVKDFSTTISEIFAANNEGTTIDINEPYQVVGSLNFTSNVAEYEEFTNLDFTFDTYLDINNETAYYDVAILNGENSIYTEEIYYNKDIAYLNIPNIFSSVLTTTIDEPIFDENDHLTFDIDEYGSIITNCFSYIIDTLKLSEMSTINKGLTNIYQYEINEENRGIITDKLMELFVNDNLLNTFLSQIMGENWQDNIEDIAPMTISFEVNVFTKKIVGFTWDTTVTTYTGSWINDNKFRISDTTGDYTDIDMYEDSFSITSIVDNKEYWQISGTSSENTAELNFITPSFTLKITSTLGSDNKATLNVKFDYDTIVVDFVMTNITSTNNINSTGNITLDISGTTIGIDFAYDINAFVEVPIKIYDNCISTSDLTEDDYNEIAENINGFINNLPENPVIDLISLFLINDEDYFYSETYVGGDIFTESTV